MTQEKLDLKDCKDCKDHQDLKERLENVDHKATLVQKDLTVYKALLDLKVCKVNEGKTDKLDLEGNKALLAYLDQLDLKDLLDLQDLKVLTVLVFLKKSA